MTIFLRVLSQSNGSLNLIINTAVKIPEQPMFDRGQFTAFPVFGLPRETNYLMLSNNAILNRDGLSVERNVAGGGGDPIHYVYSPVDVGCLYAPTSVSPPYYEDYVTIGDWYLVLLYSHQIDWTSLRQSYRPETPE